MLLTVTAGVKVGREHFKRAFNAPCLKSQIGHIEIRVSSVLCPLVCRKSEIHKKAREST